MTISLEDKEQAMKPWTRRTFILAAVATAGCAQPVINVTRTEIDAQVAEAMDVMFSSIPGSRDVAARASGVLIMPNVTEAGFFLGANYGEGALVIGEATVGYFAVAGLSFGLQIGAQQTSHALFFMTEDALFQFRTADGWKLGLDAEFTIGQDAGSAGLSTATVNKPVFALVYNQRGLIAGATLEGGKYSRIIR